MDTVCVASEYGQEWGAAYMYVNKCLIPMRCAQIASVATRVVRILWRKWAQRGGDTG